MKVQVFLTAIIVVGWVSSATIAQEVSVAGIAPDQRPANAPVVTAMTKNGDWYAHALSGVMQPYPHSLRFLEDQGPWFVPFIHPGMTGPYDIRGWHKEN